MDTASGKRDLRRNVLAQLRAIPAPLRDAHSTALRAGLAPLLQGAEVLNIALYAPLEHEVNLLPLTEQYPRHRYAFPRCGKQGAMQFHHVTAPAIQLTPGAMGILTPSEHLPVIPPQELDLIIVPGVAFTPAGARLGYGGGYYDRYLPQCTRATIIAAAFPEQMLESLPTEPHDLLIPRILTL